jgi:hypothetical protein
VDGDQQHPAGPEHPAELRQRGRNLPGGQVNDRGERDDPGQRPVRGRQLPHVGDLEGQVRLVAAGYLDDQKICGACR